MNPDQIAKHLATEEHSAAVKIQAQYRGYLARRDITNKRNFVYRTRAAIKIQRRVGTYLLSYSGCILD